MKDDHIQFDTQQANVVNNIIAEHRSREDYKNQRVATHNRMCSIIRRVTDCKKSEAPKILKGLFNGHSMGEDQKNHAIDLQALLVPFKASLEPVEEQEKEHLSRMLEYAKQLPVSEWILNVRGVGLLKLAKIVGEAGDLSNYANPAKLNKRFGLAVFDGVGQRRCKNKELALLHGFNPRRRAVMWDVGSGLIRQNDGKYRELYDRRKEKETENPEVKTKMHAHRRAQRVMEKEFLKDLWVAWNQGYCEDHEEAVLRPTNGVEV